MAEERRGRNRRASNFIARRTFLKSAGAGVVTLGRIPAILAAGRAPAFAATVGRPVELRFYHDSFGHPILDSPLELKNPQPGARLELTIDSSIQAEAENYLAGQVKTSGAQRGAAVVLDPFTGEVLALANIDADPSKMHERLHDTAVQDAFEPGSTMKGILGAIALEDRVIDTTRGVYCENG
jgi:cell division protein FtsI (penicillin-binding protein 3)